MIAKSASTFRSLLASYGTKTDADNSRNVQLRHKRNMRPSVAVLLRIVVAITTGVRQPKWTDNLMGTMAI